MSSRPHDDTPLLVLADWYEEYADTAAPYAGYAAALRWAVGCGRRPLRYRYANHHGLPLRLDRARGWNWLHEGDAGYNPNTGRWFDWARYLGRRPVSPATRRRVAAAVLPYVFDWTGPYWSTRCDYDDLMDRARPTPAAAWWALCAFWAEIGPPPPSWTPPPPEETRDA